jgi:hypothetical protein
MKIKFLAFICCVMLWIAVLPIRVEASSDFISVLPDVPLAPCYVEEVDSLITFDKPDGRYVEVSTVCQRDGTVGQEALQFYELALPQLGWRSVQSVNEAKSYVKNEEILYLKRESHMNFNRIIIVVQPAPENLG